MSTEGIGFDSLSDSCESANPQDSNNNIANRIKLIRETCGISQRQLAKRAGVTNSSISMIELGQVSPSIQSLERILSAIPISLSDFFSFQPASAISIARGSDELSPFPAAENDSLKGQLSPRSFLIPAGGSSVLGLLEYDTCGVVLTGKGELRSIAVQESLVEGDSFYIPARQLHQFSNQGEAPFKLFVCSLFAHSR